MQAKQANASRSAEITSMWGLIETVADMEGRVGQIYTGFAKMFSSRPRVVEFWQEAAADERMHALLIGATREVFTASTPAPNGKWSTQLKKLDGLVKGVEAELQMGLPLVDALSRAEAIERSELGMMTALILGRAEAAFSRFRRLRKLWRVDAHAEKLAHARARFCGRGGEQARARRQACPPRKSPRKAGL